MKYPKIENLYLRNPETHELTDTYKSYETEILEDTEWTIKEKIDGTNIRVIWDGYKVEFKGRTDNAVIQKELLEKLESIFIEELFEQQFGDTPVILFGEGYGGKVQKGTNYSDTEEFILFDVYIHIWLEMHDVGDIARQFNIQVVPWFYGDISDAIVEAKHGVSQVNEDAKYEGVVAVHELLKRNGSRNIVKIKVK